MRPRLAALATAPLVAALLLLGAAPTALAEDNRLPDGSHDVESGAVSEFACVAAGWAVDPDDWWARVQVRILADGDEVASGVADDFRQDLLDAGVSPDGNSSFGFDLWGLVSPDVPHLITAQAQDVQTAEWVDLPATPKTLTCSDVNLMPDGTHDGHQGVLGARSCLAFGWAVDPDDRYTDLNIRILADGSAIAAGVAGEFRPDLIEAGVSPDGNSGFTIDLWGQFPFDEPHAISAQAQDLESGEWVDLNLTPKTMTCATPPTETKPNPKTAYYAVNCRDQGRLDAEAVFFAAGREVGGSTSAFHVIGDNRILVIYTAGTDRNADDFCSFAWTGGWQPLSPWDEKFWADVFVAPK